MPGPALAPGPPIPSRSADFSAHFSTTRRPAIGRASSLRLACFWTITSKKQPERQSTTAIRPFTVNFSDNALADLRRSRAEKRFRRKPASLHTT